MKPRFILPILVLTLLLLFLLHSKLDASVAANPSRQWTSKQEVEYFLEQLENLQTNRPCVPVSFGEQWGSHHLCARTYRKPCVFFSFGVADDYNFEKELAQQSGCFGYALDPSVSHPTALVLNVTFMQIAANSLEENSWHTTTTVPALRRWLKTDYLPVLKMDCEGCEFALARDVASDMPDFWDSVDQFAVEIHVPRLFMKTKRHLDNYILLLQQLRKAGLKLAHADIKDCSPKDEATGCLPELVELGYPCKSRKMCQNFLFAK